MSSQVAGTDLQLPSKLVGPKGKLNLTASSENLNDNKSQIGASAASNAKENFKSRDKEAKRLDGEETNTRGEQNNQPTSIGPKNRSERRLSVVLPTNEKSLATPIIVPNEVPTPTQQLLSSLVQLNGQEFSLFTGLPSCTPTSADSLTACNPFFWDVTAFSNGPVNNQNPNGEPQEANQTANNQGSANSLKSNGNESQAPRNRCQLARLSFDRLQHANAMLSPLSFLPSIVLSSPESDAWFRLGLSSQQPLAQKKDPQHESENFHAANQINFGRPLDESQTSAYNQHQQAQQENPFRSTAQDLTNQPAAHHRNHNQTPSSQVLGTDRLAPMQATLIPQPRAPISSAYLSTRPPTCAQLSQSQLHLQSQQTTYNLPHASTYSSLIDGQQISSSQFLPITAQTISHNPPIQTKDLNFSSTPLAPQYQTQAAQVQPTTDLANNAYGQTTSQNGKQALTDDESNKTSAPFIQNLNHGAGEPPIAHHQQQTALLVMSNGHQLDPRQQVQFHQQNSVAAASRQGQTFAIHYESCPPNDLYEPDLRQFYITRHQQHSHHLQQQQQQHQQQNKMIQQQQDMQIGLQQHQIAQYRNLNDRLQVPERSHSGAHEHSVIANNSSFNDGRSCASDTTANKAPSSNSSNSLSASPKHPELGGSGNNSSSARSSISYDIDVTATAAQPSDYCSTETTLPTTVQEPPEGQAKKGQAKKQTRRPTVESEPTEGETVVKKKSKGGRKKKQVTHEELMARKNRSKERNRVAAKRCRQKRKQFLDELRGRIDNLNDLNKKLQVRCCSNKASCDSQRLYA